MAFSEVMPLDLAAMQAMDTEGRVDYLVAQGKHHGVFPRSFSKPQMLRMLGPGPGPNARAAMRYRPRPLDLPGLLVRPRGRQPGGYPISTMIPNRAGARWWPAV